MENPTKKSQDKTIEPINNEDKQTIKNIELLSPKAGSRAFFTCKKAGKK